MIGFAGPILTYEGDSLAGDDQLIAPKGTFRVADMRTFAGPEADYLIGNLDTLKEARQPAKAEAEDMNPSTSTTTKASWSSVLEDPD